ncbi:MAG: hypothetical protein HND47_16275 [Chloroflexi bacterium]|nr:hypothetical protein [Chloroflexota bacterium]
MSSQFIFVSSDKSDSEKLIRFFKVVGFLGGLVWLSRALAIGAVIGGVLFLIK